MLVEGKGYNVIEKIIVVTERRLRQIFSNLLDKLA